MSTETAVFGGGCFWCTEAIFSQLRGIQSVIAGYAGGTTENPSYTAVCSGQTGHAEVIKIEFDPLLISYADLLMVFWNTHNPTTRNKQGNDVGTQYRSIILYTSQSQKEIAEDSREQLNKTPEFEGKIVTEIVPLLVFYEAESYHKDYYEKNQEAPYCSFVITPKLKHLREKFSDKLKK